MIKYKQKQGINKMKNLKSKKAFSYIGILSALVIVSTITAIALPNYSDSINSAEKSAMLTDARNMINKQVAFYNTGNYFMEITEDNSINKNINITDSLGNKLTYSRTIGNKLSVKPIKCSNGKNGFALKINNSKSNSDLFFNQCTDSKPSLNKNAENLFKDLSKYDHYTYLASLNTGTSTGGSTQVIEDTVDTTNPFEGISGGGNNNEPETPPVNNSSLTVEDLLTLGISFSGDISVEQLATINNLIDQQNATTLTELQNIVNSVVGTGTTPTTPTPLTATDLTTMGVQTTDLTQEQLDLINSKIIEQNATSVTEIQAIVDSVNPPAPPPPVLLTISDLEILGVVSYRPITDSDMTLINDKIILLNAKTLTEIQDIVDTVIPPTTVTGLSTIPGYSYINSFAPDAGCPETSQPFVMSGSTTISSTNQPFFLGSGFILDSNAYKYYSTSTSKLTMTSNLTNGNSSTTSIFDFWSRSLYSGSSENYINYSAVPTVAKLPNATNAPKLTAVLKGPFVNFELGKTTGGTNIKVSLPNTTNACINYNSHLVYPITFNGGDHVLHIGNYSSATINAYIKRDLVMGDNVDMLTASGAGNSNTKVTIDLGEGKNALKIKSFESNVHLITGDNDDQIEIDLNKGESTNTYKNTYNLGGGNNNLLIKNSMYQIESIITGSGEDRIKLINTDSVSDYYNNIDLGSGDDILMFEGVIRPDLQVSNFIWDGGFGNDTIYFKNMTKSELSSYFNNPDFPDRENKIKFENIVGSDGIYKGRSTQELFNWNTIDFTN